MKVKKASLILTLSAVANKNGRNFFLKLENVGQAISNAVLDKAVIILNYAIMMNAIMSITNRIWRR